MVTRSKTQTATIVFEDTRYPDVAITWQIGSRILRLVSRDSQRPASVMKPVSLKGDTLEIAEAEAAHWFESLDIFAADDTEQEDDWSE